MSLFKPNIAALKAKRDLAGLLTVLKGKDVTLRREAIKAFGELGARSVVPALCEIVLAREATGGEQVDAIEALGKIGDPAAFDVLIKASTLSHERERLRIEQATTAADRRYHEGYYITQIATSEYLYRSTVANALARIGGERAVRLLFDLLATEAGQMATQVKLAIQEAMRLALQKLGDDAMPLLVEYTQRGTPDVRQWVVACLGEFGNQQVEQLLVELAENESQVFNVRQAAIISLAQIGDRDVLPFLEDMTKSTHRGLAREAAECARQIRQRYPGDE